MKPRSARSHVVILALLVAGVGLAVTPSLTLGSASQKSWAANNIMVFFTLLLNVALSIRFEGNRRRTTWWGASWLVYVLAVSSFVLPHQDFDGTVSTASFVLVSLAAWYLYWPGTPDDENEAPSD